MILAKLKEATREQHQNLESVVDIMDSTVSMTGYETLVAKFYRFYSALEAKVSAYSLEKYGFDFEARRKTHLLERDLVSLGIYDKIDEIVPEWTDLPLIDSPARAFGSVYVMEGATLGGQVITRHLAQHHAITPDNGCAFFNSYGDQVGPKWKEFGVAITAFASTGTDDEAIVSAAVDTFDSFTRCFSQKVNVQKA